jgi:mRNA-degrading endonuclease RelE of RelBE toxin-antitoxin system
MKSVKSTGSKGPRYKVIFDDRAEKEFVALSPGRRKALWDKLKLLETDPAPSEATQLRGYEPLRRIKAGDARAIFDEPDANDRIFILRVGVDHDIYGDLEQLLPNDNEKR